jgi:hypothetical protein
LVFGRGAGVCDAGVGAGGWGWYWRPRIMTLPAACPASGQGHRKSWNPRRRGAVAHLLLDGGGAQLYAVEHGGVDHVDARVDLVAHKHLLGGGGNRAFRWSGSARATGSEKPVARRLLLLCQGGETAAWKAGPEQPTAINSTVSRAKQAGRQAGKRAGTQASNVPALAWGFSTKRSTLPSPSVTTTPYLEGSSTRVTWRG